MSKHFTKLTIGLVFSVWLATVARAQGNILVLDSDGNYVDASFITTDERPYAAPAVALDLAEEGEPFFDPNTGAATDTSQQESPYSLYEAILKETDVLKSESASNSTTSSFLAEGSKAREKSVPAELHTGVGDINLKTAPPGDLVFATLVKPEESLSEMPESVNQIPAAPVVLKTMPSLNMIKEDEFVEGVTKTDQGLFDAIIYAEIAKYENVDVAFIKAVISAESNYNTIAVSPKGAMGLMQIMPDTAKRYDVVNPFSPEQNIRAGTAELSRLMTLYRNPSLALAAYNAGEGAVEKYDGVPPFSETQEYIVRVLTKTFRARERNLRQIQTESAKIVKQKTPEKEANPLLRPLVVQTFDY